MGIQTSLMKTVDWLTTLGHGVASDYSRIETGIDGTTICKDGSVYSIITFRGSCIMMGNKELIELIDRMATRLSSSLSDRGHALEFNFSRNPDTSYGLVDNLIAPQRNIAKKLDLSLDYIFKEQENFLPRWIAREDIHIVLWTRPSIFSRDEKIAVDKEREIQRERDRKDKNMWSFLFPQAPDTQHAEKASRMLMVRHEAFVRSFLSDADSIGLSFQLMDSWSAMRAVYNSLYPDKLEGNWRAVLPEDIQVSQAVRKEDNSDKIFTKWVRENAQDDLSALLWPRMDDQLFTDEPEYINSQYCRIGTNYFATVDMITAPLEIQPFMFLLRNVMKQDGGREFPWRMSLKVEGDGLKGTGIQSALAGTLGIFTPNGHNKNIKRSLMALKAREEAGEKIVRVRLSFTTWSPVSEGKNKIENRLLALSKAVEGWGDIQVATISGDPIASAMGTTLGLSMASTAPAGVAPIRDILYMLPWGRDVSPWEKGSCLFRTEDGRPFSLEIGSSLQDTFNYLMVGPPGKGKSFLLATVNYASCLSPRTTDGIGGYGLPYIRSIDIGHSQSGFCRAIRDALPESKKHEVVYKTMEMTPDCAINMMGTPLGNRTPLPLDANALKNALCIIASSEDGTLPDHMADMIGDIISGIYKKYSDKEPRDASPKKYSPSVNQEVNKALQRHGIDMDRCVYWWDVVDILALEKHDYYMASVAQRYAVPQFRDLISFSSESIKRLYGAVKTKTGVSLIETFNLRVQAAINEYPILAHPTAFDIHDAKIAILDIKNICNASVGPIAQKQNGLMYMLSRFVLSSEFYRKAEEIRFFNPDYREHHLRSIARIESMIKIMEYDEFHRTKGVEFVRNQIVKDFREGRKYNIMNMLASQSINDFDDDMFTFSSGTWIMGCDDNEEREEVCRRLNLSTAAQYKLYNSLNGPSADGSGAPFLVCLKVRDGYPHEHFLKNTPGPLMAWAFSTTAEDTSLRDMLYRRMPQEDARIVLAKRFPRGSAKKEIEAITNARAKNQNQDIMGENGKSVIEEIADDLEMMWLKMSNATR